MKALLVLPLLLLTLALASCGDDEAEAERAAYQADVIDLQRQWETYRQSINNSYNMVYIEQSNEVSTTGLRSSRVRNGIIQNSNQGDLTMDRIYTALLSLFENDLCDIEELKVEEQRPVIREFIYNCGDTEYRTVINSLTPVQE